MTIPSKILEMVVEARSDHNDGWTKELCRQRLGEIKDPEIKKTVESILRRKERNGSCEYHI